MTTRTLTTAALVAVIGLGAAGCSGPSGADSGAGASSASSETVTVTNCGQEVTFPSPVQRMLVNDSNMIATTLAVGAADQIVAVTGLEKDKAVLEEVYGAEEVAGLKELGEVGIGLEPILAQRPDMVFAGYNYGFGEGRNLMPDDLAQRGIAPYVLTESCRRSPDQEERGEMDPWKALAADLTNIGTVTGHEDRAKEVQADIDTRLAKLRKAPQAQRKPVVFLFDSGTDAPFSSGVYGGPQGIIEAAGATNLAEDVKDTWTAISWEKVAAGKPDYIAIVDYPGESVADKVRTLRTNPATKDLPAVKQGRIVALPYVAWTSSPLNIDAAESLRKALEEADLVPASGITPTHDLRVHP
ncbi:iron transporter [Kytococcus schroeteri]|uniref:Iron transporter n=1 Tax=Kytococcus schroeteri TaxID=138300 RepID=A0A2I1PC62_9MICO|nr:ABC transporter substrate-binding protein [Kytococcus schroeteri]PKZ42217.1 iron transporter [Kytococcus schroeteri]